MLPYLAAIGMLSAGGVPPAVAAAVLAGYVALMVVPGSGRWSPCGTPVAGPSACSTGCAGSSSREATRF